MGRTELGYIGELFNNPKTKLVVTLAPYHSEEIRVKLETKPFVSWMKLDSEVNNRDDLLCQ